MSSTSDKPLTTTAASSPDDAEQHRKLGAAGIPTSMRGVAKVTSDSTPEDGPKMRSMAMARPTSLSDTSTRSIYAMSGGEHSIISRGQFLRPHQSKPFGVTGSNWRVKDDGLRCVPSYYPLEKSSRFVTGEKPSHIASRISDCCRLMSVQAEFDDILGTASLYTAEHVEIYLSLWQGAGPKYPDCVIVEAQRRSGCAVTYHKYCRNILDAAQGEFDLEQFGDVHGYSLMAEQLLERKSPRGTTEHENSLLAIEIAASLLKKDRMDARRLGMESFCLLTDVSKTGIETALLTSRVVLLGSVHDENTDDDEFLPDELGVREAILSLVQFGRLGDDGEFKGDDDIDSDDESVNAHPEEKQHNDLLHNLALAVLANALDVLENHGKNMASHQSASQVANTFLDETTEMSSRDILETLLGFLGDAESKPHDAYLSAQCLRSLFQASKKARRRARDLNAKQVVVTALDVGRRTHVKLETETNKIVAALERADDDDDDSEQE